MKHILYALNGTFLMLLVPALFVLALRQLSHEANQKLVNTFGFNSQIIAGGLGIIVHELSHLIMAIIFGHHINAVSLLRIPSNTNDMSLGYVKHTWSPTSTYQKVGNAFIGIAPVLGCTLLIYIIMRTLNAPISLVQNQLTTQLLSNGNALNWNFLTHSWIYIFELFQLNFDSIWHSIVALLLVISLCFGGFDLSEADISSGKYAFLGLIGITFIMLLLVSFLSFHAALLPFLVNITVWIYLVFIISIVILAIINLIMYILNIIL